MIKFLSLIFALLITSTTSALEVVKTKDSSRYKVILDNNNWIYTPAENYLKPELLKQLNTPTELIYIVQEHPTGNACDGGDIHILWIDRSSKSNRSSQRKIDNCGHTPVISLENGYIKLETPAWLNTRWNIEGDLIHGETWLYKPNWEI